ncbi:CD83 antigen [Genypterus blacodes]|uniref:CD83 antigen n=1 Tax=Genypterus blacodes TaxID=154954 RepID=UPI003F76C59E
MMSSLLSILLLLSLCVCGGVTEEQVGVRCVCGEVCPLTCTAQPKPGVQYRGLRWYREVEFSADSLRGLLTRSLPNGTVHFYTGVEREVALQEDSLHLLLPNVTHSDAMVYVCLLEAPVGEKNREGRVQLTLTGCPGQPSDAQMDDAALVIGASVLLLLVLIGLLFSYGILRNVLTDRKKPQKEEHLDAAFKPLEPKEVKSMLTLGPNWSRTSCMKQQYV